MASPSPNGSVLLKRFAVLFITVAAVFALLFHTNRSNSVETINCEAKDDSSILERQVQNLYKSQSKDRQNLLGAYLDPKTASKEFGPFYNALVTEIVCPGLVRVGNVNDGGKWTCNPWALPADCVIYSLGVGPDITFELQMDAVTEKRCKIYSFDPNPDLGRNLVNLKSERFIFTPLLIASKTDAAQNHKTVADIKKQFNHKFIDFFKIDIEGAEFTVMPFLLGNRSEPLACQIFVEMHGTPHQCATLFSQLSKAGYYMFSYELNGYHTELSEYSFMHESCFHHYGVTTVLSRIFPE